MRAIKHKANRFLIAASLLLTPSAAFAQSPPEPPQPTAEHEWLTKFVGSWATDMEAMMSPDEPPMKCEGTMNSRSLGGFWVMNEMKGEMAGVAMTGVQTIGYDPKKQKYVGTWVDSMSTHLWRYEGEVDESGKKLTLLADGPNFMGDGEMAKFRDTYEFVSEDEILATSSMLDPDGEWIDFAKGRMTRRGK